MKQMQQWPAKLWSSQIRTPKKILASKRFCGPSCMQLCQLGNSAKWLEKESQRVAMKQRVRQLQGAGMRKVYDEWWPNQWLYNSTIHSKTPLGTHHFEKLWNSSSPRKNSTLLGAQALNSIFFGHLLWRKDPIWDDLGWRKVGMGSSTPSTPLERIVYEKIFRRDGYA